MLLLREMGGRTGEKVQITPLHQIPVIADVQILDVFAVAGTFDAVLICRVPTNRTVAQLPERAQWVAHRCPPRHRTYAVRNNLGIPERCDVLALIHFPDVLLLTARTKKQDLLRGLGLGADDYLTKPLFSTALYAAVQWLTNQTSSWLVLHRYGKAVN